MTPEEMVKEGFSPFPNSKQVMAAKFTPDPNDGQMGVDILTGTLTVVFKSNPNCAYEYLGVEESVYAGLLTSPSPGGYLAENVTKRKGGSFPWQKVELATRKVLAVSAPQMPKESAQ